MAERRFISQIRQAHADGRLTYPISADSLKREVPGWAERTYHTFLSKHARGNPGRETELFVRIMPGLYELLT